MLISAVQHSDSHTHTHTHILFHYDLSQHIEYSSLCYRVDFVDYLPFISEFGYLYLLSLFCLYQSS